MKPTLAALFCVCSILATAFGQSALAPLPPDGFVTLEQIVNDFSTSTDQAYQKYNGMRICVYGRVGKVARSGDDDGDPLVVFMRLPNRETPDVMAKFDQDFIPSSVVTVADNDSKATVFHADWNGNLTNQSSFIVTGENVAVRGTFDNYVAGDIVLKNSFKLSPAALAKKLSEHGIATE